MKIGTWNVRTLNDTRTASRRTALIGLEMKRLGIDVAGLCETRFPGSGTTYEPTSGYTYFWSGVGVGEKQLHGVALVMKKTVADSMESSPVAINERLISARIPLTGGRSATFICAYAPTMTNDDSTKEKFYKDLDTAISAVPKADKLIILGDMNARVGSNHLLWPNQIGKYGTGKCNDNGLLLLSKCSEHALAITNTWFRHKEVHKTTWMHPRSRHWHLIDYTIVRRSDLKDVLDTRVQRSAEWETDHQLVVSKLKLQIVPKRKHRNFTVPKLNAGSLRNLETQEKLRSAFHDALSDVDNDSDENEIKAPTSINEQWATLRDQIVSIAEETLPARKKKEADWFAENVVSLEPLLNAKKRAYAAHIQRPMRATTAKLKTAISALKKETRTCQSRWVQEKAQMIQQCADQNDMKGFYELINEIYGPTHKSFASLKTADGTLLLTDQQEVLFRWGEHFEELLNRPSTVDEEIIDSVPARPLVNAAEIEPSLAEIVTIIKNLKNGKSPGDDGIPPEIFKYGGQKLTRKLYRLIIQIWRSEEIPQQFKDATIVSIYKNKGSRAECGNYRGISLLSTAGKIVAKVIQSRLVSHILDNCVSESQCGFRNARSTIDMIFTARQLQEKCIEQDVGLYAVFIDLMKAFDTVNRDALWKVLARMGCPPKLITIIRQLHDGMTAKVRVDGSTTDRFNVRTGVKQGCVIAPILFIIYFSAMLENALSENTDGVYLRVRTDGSLFNIARLRAKTKVREQLIRDLLFADDCGLFAHSVTDLQRLMNCFPSLLGPSALPSA